MGYSDKLISRTVTICLDAKNAVTHAFQTDLVQVIKDGEPFGSPQQGSHENLKPADIGKAVPQAGVLAQLSQAQHELEDAKATATKEAETAKADFTTQIGNLQAELDKTKAAATADADAAAHTIGNLQTQLDQANANLQRVVMHVGQLGAAVEAVTATPPSTAQAAQAEAPATQNASPKAASSRLAAPPAASSRKGKRK